MLDRLIVDQNKVFLIQKDKSAVLPLSPGFGMGFSGIYYFLRFAGAKLIKENPQLSTKIKAHFASFDPIEFAESYLKQIKNSEIFPISHGYNAGVVGLLLANKPIQGFEFDSEKNLEDAFEFICQHYANFDFSKLNHSFYGGTAGVIFGLAQANNNVHKKHDQSTQIILRAADELAKIANTGEFEKFFSLMKVYPTMMGLSWGTSGIIMALTIATTFENKLEYQKAIQILVQHEDQFIDPGTQKRTNLSVMSDGKSGNWNPLCYGSTGILLSRQNRSPHVVFDSSRTQCDLDEVKSLNLNSLDMREFQKLSICCGVAGMMESASEYDKDDNSLSTMENFLFENLHKQQNEPASDMFLQGVTGVLYVLMKRRYKIKDSLWSIK